ncbi:MAG: nuclear transport factor 2 family protein [Acidimicrobiia bacterium]
MTPEDLVEIELIKRLKYRYFRCIDRKLWKELETCFTEDATAAYSAGHYSFTGRDAIMEFLRGSMSSDQFLSSHKVHHPEIDLTSPTTATGTWALEDYVIVADAGINIHGAAYYEDEYVKVGGEWKIRHTGYERIFEEMGMRSDTPSLRLTASYWGTGGRSEIDVP